MRIVGALSCLCTFLLTFFLASTSETPLHDAVQKVRLTVCMNSRVVEFSSLSQRQRGRATISPYLPAKRNALKQAGILDGEGFSSRSCPPPSGTTGLPAGFLARGLAQERCLEPELVSTFSIAAVDLENGDVGVAVQSKFPNVRPVVPWMEVGVGAIATQSFVNVSYGSRGLALMKNGATAHDALRILVESDSLKEIRQAGIVDAQGNAASWTGKECFDWAGGIAGENFGGKGVMVTGKGFAAQGNVLVGKETVDAMTETFKKTKGSLADRLLAALLAGGKAGGDRRGEQSAALVVKRKGAGYDGTTDDFIDISVYDHATPLKELERLYQLHKLFFFRSEPGNLIKIDAALCKELQTILKDKAYKGMEFYVGPVNGVFDGATKKALQDFMGWENYDVRIRADDQIDKEVLADIRKNVAEWKGRKKK